MGSQLSLDLNILEQISMSYVFCTEGGFLVGCRLSSSYIIGYTEIKLNKTILSVLILELTANIMNKNYFYTVARSKYVPYVKK